MSFILYPALDIRQGQVVRLLQGDYQKQTIYGDDPLAYAQAFAQAGAQWLHLVDLDAAKSGGYTLASLVKQITTHTALKIQTGGGVRSYDDVARIIEAGASRVVIGSLAVREPDNIYKWLDQFGADYLTIALDTRQDNNGKWRLPIHGWTQVATEDLDTMALNYAHHGMKHLLCTDIARDGMLSGPNIELYAHLRQLLPDVSLQASGGVRNNEDIVVAQAIGCNGAVLGKSLLEGYVSLTEALKYIKNNDEN